jgi:hypothetical protein
MKITPDMIAAARRAEYDYHPRAGLIGPGRFIPTPDPILKAMLEATLATGSPLAARA